MDQSSSETANLVSWLCASLVAGAAITGSAWVVSPLSAPATPADGVLLISWWVCAVIAGWFIASVIMWRLALGLGWSGLTAIAIRVAAPGARKLVETTLALTVLVGAGACSTRAVDEAPVMSLISTGVSSATSTPPTPVTAEALTTSGAPLKLTEETSLVSANLSPEPHPYSDQPELPVVNTGDSTKPTDLYEVVEGDNLWDIARATLTSELGRQAASAEIAPYWQKLVATNLNSISSGDPDLIYPGELFQLPSPSD
jgi:nucleoid-associated protein YgaU